MPLPPRKPGDSQPPKSESAAAEAVKTTAGAELTHGAVYTGEVTSRDADGTYTVSLQDPKKQIMGVRIAFPVLGGLLGLNVLCNLPQLTRVKVAYGKPSFIIATIPEVPADFRNGRSRSLLWGPQADGAVGVTDGFGYHAEDLLEGEVEISNLYGVALDFLTTLMRMRAGERAMVECHLINDMVRVVSGQYRHISGLGDDLMFDHGRPTRERTWSSYRHEVMGVLKENDEFASLDGDEVNREQFDSRRVIGLGRHRFHEFMGFAGDFIHSFVSDPPSTIIAMTKTQAAAGAGKSWFHRNSDGTVIIQSVADIRLERVCRIPVPIRCEGHEDPGVTSERKYDELDDIKKAFLKLPKVISPTEDTNAFQMAYHIRSYARWLGRYHAFARMLQLDSEYTVPAEANIDGLPMPDWNNAEKDRKEENARVNYYDAYACISIMRDGSIVLHDGYGSSVMMSNGNIQISASRHLDLQAAGDIRIVAGNSILMKARRNIELSATVGGLILHSYSWLKLLCERGTTWVRSNAITKAGTDLEELRKENGPLPEVAGLEEEADGQAVLIEASEGGAAFRSLRGMSIAVDGSDGGATSNFDLNIASKGGKLDLYGGRSAALHSARHVILASQQMVAIYSSSLLSNASRVLIGPSLTNPQFTVISGRMFCREVLAKSVRANSIAGPELGPRIPIPDPQPMLSLKRHYNHIRVLDTLIPDAAPGNAREQAAMEEATTTATARPNLPWVGPSDGPYWSFPEPEEYVWDSREDSPSAVPETITNQHLRLDITTSNPLGDGKDRWGGPGYEDWSLRTNLIGSRTESQGGYGFNEPVMLADSQGDDLHKPTTNSAAGTTEVKTSWTPAPSNTMKSLKRPE